MKGRLQGYEWSPDSKRLALVIGDPDPDAPDPSATPAPGTPPKPPKPIVIDRYRYKQDVQGYLLSGRHTYLYLYDIAGKKLDRLTKSKWDESSPSWSPDSSRIAFMSSHADDPDRDPEGRERGPDDPDRVPEGRERGRDEPDRGSEGSEPGPDRRHLPGAFLLY